MNTAVAILGYGTVGSGVFQMLSERRLGLEVKYVLDLRDFPGEPVQEKIVHDFEQILADDEVKIVAELMGGINAAYDFVNRALLKGKSVVTSNKALMAEHGAELLKTAKGKNVNLLFEASVGGGIPIIRAMNTSLAGDEIYELHGILNGTTNYILTKMTKENFSFEQALKNAQDKGYAEKDPSEDVNGLDACRKLAILLSLATGKRVEYTDIYTEGIGNITSADIEYGKKIGASIKLLAEGKITAEGVFASVEPVLISNEHPLANVNKVYNAIYVLGRYAGELMFYGKGAGKLATASAVAADMLEAAKHLDENLGYYRSMDKQKIMNSTEETLAMLIRVAYNDKEEAISAVKRILQPEQFIFIDRAEDEFAVLIKEAEQKEIDRRTELLKSEKSIKQIRLRIKAEV